MKRFLNKIMVFCLLSLCVLIVADYGYSKVFQKVSTGNMEMWRDVMEGNAYADIWFSGDSRVNTGCYPPVIDSITGLKSYSGGVIGHHFTIQRLRYDMLRKYNKKPDVIVQFVDNWLFKPLDYSDRSQFLPWMWNPHFLIEIFSRDPLPSLRMSLPWFRYHGHRLMGMKWGTKSTSRGFFTYDHDSSFSRIDDSQLVMHRHPRNERLFRSFLSEVSAEGIKIVLVMSPYYDCPGLSQDLMTKNREYFETIAREYDIPFLDYSDIPQCEDKSLFLDGIHLNKKGAIFFSELLANDIIRLGII